MTWAPSYASEQELAHYLRVSDGDDDVELRLAIAAASRSIDVECRRQFGVLDVAAARVYTARLEDGWVVYTDDLSSAGGVAVAVDSAGDGSFATTLTGYSLGPANAAADGRPFTELRSRVGLPATRDSVRITGLWGWTAVPDTIHEACLLQASRFHARRDSPYGVTGSPDNGGELRLLSKVDPDVAVMLRPFRRRWWAV